MNLIVKAWNNIVGVALVSIELMWTELSKLKSIVELLRQMSLPGFEWGVESGQTYLYLASETPVDKFKKK